MIDCNLQHILHNVIKSLEDSGLGNNLFQISATIGIGNKFDISWQVSDIEKINKLLKKFGGNHQKTIYRNVKVGKYNSDNIYLKEETNIFNEEFLKKIKENKENNIIINGYFQSYKYFENSRDELINLFSPDEQSLEKIKKKYNRLFEDHYECISLHIRNNWADRFKYSEQYFIDAINYIKNKRKNKNYILFIVSDDIENLKDKFLKNYEIKKIWVQDNPDYIDMWVMMFCKHNILSHSTLSWWGAYLNNNIDKIVIYPRKWIESIYWKQIEKDNTYQKRFEESHYPKEWVGLDTKIFK